MQNLKFGNEFGDAQRLKAQFPPAQVGHPALAAILEQFWIQNPLQRCKNSCQCSVELGQSVCNAWPSTSLPLKALTRLSWEAVVG